MENAPILPPVPPMPETIPTPAEQENPKRRLWRMLVETAQTILLAAVFYILISVTTARVVVDGPSMRPTLRSGEWVVVNRLAYRIGKPERGDVVVILPPTSGQTDDLIKRVIGLPGQTVEIRGGVVFINGERIEEPYILGRTFPSGTWKLKTDELFLMGDNRELSLDSRSFGPVQMGMVVGKAEVIYWPPAEWGPIAWRVPTPLPLNSKSEATPLGATVPYPYPDANTAVNSTEVVPSGQNVYPSSAIYP